MAVIHARRIGGRVLFRMYSRILKEYRSEPMSRNKMRKFFRERTFSLLDKDPQGGIEARLRRAKERGTSSPQEKPTQLDSSWV